MEINLCLFVEDRQKINSVGQVDVFKAFLKERLNYIVISTPDLAKNFCVGLMKPKHLPLVCKVHLFKQTSTCTGVFAHWDVQNMPPIK